MFDQLLSIYNFYYFLSPLTQGFYGDNSSSDIYFIIFLLFGLGLTEAVLVLSTSWWAGVLEARLEIAQSPFARPWVSSALRLLAPYQLTCPAFLVLNLNKTQILHLLLFVFLPMFCLLKFKSNLCIFVLFFQNSHHGYGDQGTQFCRIMYSTQRRRN